MFRRLWKRIKRIFSSQQDSKPIEVPPSKPSGLKKVAVVVGHTHYDGGASTYDGSNEWTYNSKIASLIEDHFISHPSLEVKVFKKNYSNSSAEVAGRVGDWGAQVSLELHLNAYDKVAFGSEILITEKKSLQLATKLLDAICKEFDTRRRGVKLITKGGRGYNNIKRMGWQGVHHALLVEPVFANLKNAESVKFMENPKRYADTLIKFIEELK